MTKQELYNLKMGDILTNKISNKQFEVYETLTYGTYLLVNQTDLIFEYINPCNYSTYTISL